ncbi:MAG: MEKHLA domain-containing protein [Zetaproteobacteria bacterium CG_4_9_14_3_um_filter_49_83]|nr:MAG: MEKHLA domain-containing protein [Zetaproteobacteria bacterium CG1_02_49_23]PIQ30621.1 MAG: MEKHLA domain-containing protein [Zetaproteobacteria bacterium CG17_big_fil_post_rev_8_21_14_2_50_50_13]PIV31475.1 MAG: MEKHLA domain-containing protein [Zetaproteobacteria bacterium CG02_land_8_20_14_3_00_50_9]PIY56918.1 MAG: MEKHLA domain-containing protein [Zetaproteobacteria bacterium CG_4_10_14_0_8_um_filter_49_80]PJA35826.1 MAG: MEKHLA domain-containing protein [Zetaproteobacteria bacterium
MQANAEPNPANNFLAAHAGLLISSFRRLTGRDLVCCEEPASDLPRALFEAPFAVLSHTTDADPVFNYANQTAMQLFEMDWQTFTHLPSRHSAEPLAREERARLLERVTCNGFVDDYRGVRISATGKRFLLEEATVWNLIDEDGIYCGQAAALFRWSGL